MENKKIISFDKWSSINELKEASETTVKDVLNLKKNEKILIITNPEKNVFRISQAIFDAALDIGAKPIIITQEEKTQLDFAEDAVIEAIKSEPDVVLSISSGKMGKDKFGISQSYVHEGKTYDHIFHLLMYGKKTVRSFWSPGITEEMFSKTVKINYGRLKAECKKVKVVLDKAEKVLITNFGGTDLEIGLNNRVAFVDDGDFSKKGSGGNLPAGEAFISPELGRTNGTIVFDGSISSHEGDIIIKNPIVAKVENGFVVDISGGEEAKKLKETITLGEQNAIKFEKEGKLPEGKGEIYKKNARNIGELGIGLNPAAEVIGNMLEDEKAYKTCHIAIGSNYDEDAPSLIHLDGLISKPTITAIMPDGDKKIILQDGDLIL